MVPQGRPLLTEMLALADKAPAAFLKALPSIKAVSTVTYGEASLNEELDFVLAQAPRDERAFFCIDDLFDCMPCEVIVSHIAKLVNTTINCLQVASPLFHAFLCVKKFRRGADLLREEGIHRQPPSARCLVSRL
jgi:hypothetical protein